MAFLQKKNLMFNFGPHIISVTSPTFSFYIIPSQGRSQEFDWGGHKWVKETKQPDKKI